MDMQSNSQSHDSDRPASRISIPQLSPDLQDPEGYFFEAVVTLVWPFSSSSRLFSLLLAEPDFRLRNQNGQIRVTFCGICAEQVALTKVGIGDTVKLNLKGARWTENKKIQSTPGKSLSWELQYKNRVKFEARRNGEQTAALDIDQPSSLNAEIWALEPSTPASFANDRTTPVAGHEKWESPAFFHTKRLLSHSPPQPDFDPFAEEDGYIPGKGRKRPRFSFPSSQWRFVDESESPTEDLPGNDENWFESDEENLDQRDDQDDLVVAVIQPPHEANTLKELSSNAVIGQAETGKVRLVDSKTTQRLTQLETSAPTEPKSFQIISSHPEEDSLEPSLQTTKSSADNGHLGSFISPDAPTSPFIAESTESSGHFHGSSNAVSIQSPISTSANGNLSGQARSDSMSNAHDASSWSGTEVFGTDPQVSSTNVPGVVSHLPPDCPEPIISTAIGQHENHPFAVAVQTPCFYAEQIAATTDRSHLLERLDHNMNDADRHRKDDVEIDNLQEQLHIYAKAIDTERLMDVQEIEEINSEDEGGKAEIKGSSGGFLNQLHSATREEADPSLQHPASGETSDAKSQFNSQLVDVEEDESDVEDLEDESSFDNVEEDPEDIMSDVLESEDDYTSESGDDLCDESVSEPEVPQRIVHPEVIVIDSDSEDEPVPSKAPPTLQDRVATQYFTHDNYANQDDEHKEHEGEEHGYGKYENVERNGDERQSDVDTYHSEHQDDKNLAAHDAYVSDEEPPSSNDFQNENEKNFDMYTDEEAKDFMEEDNVKDLVQPLKVELSNETMQLNAGEPLMPNAPSDRYTPEDSMTSGNVTEDAPLEGEVLSIEDNETNVLSKNSAPPSLRGEISEPQHYQGLSGNTHRLVYRTVSPKPVPTPLLNLNEELSYETVENTADVPANGVSLSASDVVEAGTDVDARHRRWTDGPDEESVRELERAWPDKESIDCRATMEGNNDTFEEIDEVILVRNHHPIQPNLDVGRPSYTSEEPDMRNSPGDSAFHTGEVKIYPTLKTLAEWLDKAVDVISLVVDTSPAEFVTASEEYYQLGLRITDMSMAGTTIFVCIVRHQETSLPAFIEGDVVLLHNFEVQSVDENLKLIGSKNSAWAIIRNDGEPRISTPVLTFGQHELTLIKTLQEWYREDGAAMVADHMLQLSIVQEEQHLSPLSISSSNAGSPDSVVSGPASSRRGPRRKKNHRRVTIHELRDGRRYSDFGFQSGDLIHELRDGTVYAHSFERDQ